LSERSINSLQSNISKRLGSDGKLILEEYKRYFNNNLYMYCGRKSNQVKACPHYPSDNTRFQIRYAKATLFILKAILTT